MNAVAAAAAEYVENGWALVPIEAGTKAAKGKDWNTRERCITTVDRARTLRSSVGLAHAYSGTCALDIDALEETRAEFARRGLDLDKYLTADDRVGIASGRQDRAKLVFSTPVVRLTCDGPRGRDGKAIFQFRCADSRGNTYQDVLPPSPHPSSGQCYAWALGPRGNWRRPPMLPPELAVLWLELDRFGVARPEFAGDPLDAIRTPTGLTIDEVRALLAQLDATPYDDWIRVGMGVHFEFGDAGFDLWVEWSATARNYAGREDCEKRWDGFGVRQGAPITLRYLLKRVKEAGGTLPGKHADVYDPTAEAAVLPVPQVMAAANDASSSTPTPPTVAEAPRWARFRPIPAHEFASLPAPPWIVRGVLPKAAVGVVFGESGSGKSFLVVDLTAAIARGAPWRGLRTARCRVVYVVAEGAGGFRLRLRAYAQANGIDLAELPLAIIGAAPNLLLTPDVKDLADAIVATGGADVIVVDTLAQTTPGGNENSGEDMGKALAHCRALHTRTGGLVLLVHHSGKDSSKGARGWSGLRAAADVELEVTRNGDARCVRVSKLKDGADGAEYAFRLDTVVLELDDEGVEVTSCVVRHTDEGGPRSAPEPRGTVERIVLRTLAELEGLGGAAVSERELVTTAAAELPATGAKKDQRRARVGRALGTLEHDGAIVREGELVRAAR